MTKMRGGADALSFTEDFLPQSSPAPPAPLRILIVSSVRLVRDGLVLVLRQRTSVSGVFSAATPADAVSAITEFRPTIVVLDLANDNALGAARLLRQASQGMQIVGFSAGEHEPDVLSYAEAGIAGFVSPDASMDELLAAIDRAATGELLCSPRAAGAMFRRLAVLSAQYRGDSAALPLTSRELEIVHRINMGLSNKGIARDLRIGLSTVKNHVHNILEKLRVSRRGESAARFREASMPQRPRVQIPTDQRN